MIWIRGRINKWILCRMITNEMYSSAFVALAIAGASDWVIIMTIRFAFFFIFQFEN